MSNISKILNINQDKEKQKGVDFILSETKKKLILSRKSSKINI